MLNVALPVFEVISVVLAIFPIPSHWRAKNISMLMLVFWLILGNLNNFINRVIWIKDADNKAPGWCDISVKIMSMVTMGIPCAALCISIKLYRIASMRFKPRTMIERRNGALIDLAWMIFTPVAYALLTLINQGHRFNVVEGQGCQPAIYFTPVAAFVDYGLPLGISFISILCSLMALGYFIVQKKNFEHVVSQSRCGLNTKRFIRMTSFTIIDLMLTFPTLLANFGLELAYTPMFTYKSWNIVHQRFDDVWKYTADLFETPQGKRYLILSLFSAWALCASGFMFYLVFGFSSDAFTENSQPYVTFKSLFVKDIDPMEVPLNINVGTDYEKQEEMTLSGSLNMEASNDSIKCAQSDIESDMSDLSENSEHMNYPKE